MEPRRIADRPQTRNRKEFRAMNRVFHFEIAAQNPDQAISFYAKTFGWKIERWGEQDYWLIETGDESTPGINGAITHATRALATTVNTIGVTDLDAMVK